AAAAAADPSAISSSAAHSFIQSPIDPQPQLYLEQLQQQQHLEQQHLEQQQQQQQQDSLQHSGSLLETSLSRVAGTTRSAAAAAAPAPAAAAAAAAAGSLLQLQAAAKSPALFAGQVAAASVEMMPDTEEQIALLPNCVFYTSYPGTCIPETAHSPCRSKP
ncbi:hypothetical protein, conserved, partial [Eimeria tenella]